METEPKPRIHKKRRERLAHRVQLEQTDSEGEQNGDEKICPARGAKERSRSKPRKKKNNVGTYEEDIIDGFAIVSFKSIGDLEKYTSGKLTNKCNGTDKNKRNNSLSPGRHKVKPNLKKNGRMTPNILPKRKKRNNSAADNSESSGETTDNLDASDLILNIPKKTNSRRFSDVSTRSSSGAGYLCDSESGDERVSDTSLDIFTTKPLNTNLRVSIEQQEIKPSFPPVSSLTTTITTACPVTSTTSDVTVTTVTTTTSCVSLTAALTTTAITVTTACPTVITSNGSNHISHHNHHHAPHPPHQNHQSHAVHHHPIIEKYPPHVNHAPKPHHDRDGRPSGSPVIKRRPVTPTLTKPVSKSPPRYKAPPPLSSITTSSSSPAVSLAPSISSTSNTVISQREPKRASPLVRTPVRRPDSRERESYQVLPPNLTTTKSFFPPGFPSHGSATPGLYSSLGPSPGLHPLHSSASQQAAFPGGPTGLPSLHPHHQAGPPTPHTPHMFAAPLPLGPPAGPLAASAPAPPAHIQPESPLSLTSPDLLRHELNRRFLASQERSPLQLPTLPQLMQQQQQQQQQAAADIHQHMHQHQHQHQHQHMHQHMYHPGLGPPPPPVSVAAPSLVHTPTSNPYEKLSSSPLFRPGLPHRPPGIAEPAPRLLKDKPPSIPQHPRASSIPGLPGYPSLLLNPSAPDALNSGIPGAFQPKGLSGIHPSVGPMFLPGRDLEKAAVPPAISAAQSSLPTTAKKPGKWCAVHVRIAWQIHHYQQKQGDKGPDSKPSVDPLRPPSQLMPPGSSLLRPQELPSSVSSSLLSSGRGGLFDNPSHSLLNTVSHIGPPFQRPSPYSLGSGLPVGVGNGITSMSRESPMLMASGSHEWNRLHHHRTPPTFQVTPSSWGSKVEEREKELERERERERELSLERRREEERERERRLLDQDRHRFPPYDDRSRDRFRESELLAKSRSRSRSRSPMRNGRLEHPKQERTFDRRFDENGMLKVKEERRESFTREEELLSERDRLLKNEYLTSGALRGADPFMQASLVERARMLTPAAFLGGDRMQHHPSLWNPFDKGPVDFANHRLSLQREMEQTRDQLLNQRFPMPGVQTAFPGFSLEQERLREEMILRDTERAKRDYLERLPMMERERLYYENSKIPGLRPPDGLAMGHLYSRNMSPALNHIKRSSPCVIPGAPPPLIHSGSSSQARGHNSPAVNKTKGVSPTDSVGESKRDSNSNSTDPDAHSR